MSTPGAAAQHADRPSRLRVFVALGLCVTAAAVITWRLTSQGGPPAIAPSLEDRSIKLRQELMLLEQKQPPPEPEVAPVEPTRAARKAK